MGGIVYKDWGKIIWARTITPRHAPTAWFFMHQRLPVKCRLARFSSQNAGLECALCEAEEEDFDHLFFWCMWAKEYWLAIKQWWPTTIDTSSTRDFMHTLLHLKGPKREKIVTYAIYVAGIYQIWRTRNEMIFAQHLYQYRLSSSSPNAILYRGSLHSIES